MMIDWPAGLMKGWMSIEMKNAAFFPNVLLGLIKTTGHNMIHSEQRMKAEELRDKAVAVEK